MAKRARPPKKWIGRCVSRVESSGLKPRSGSKKRAAGAICGSLWYHKMKPSKKRALKRKYYKSNPTRDQWFGLFAGAFPGYILGKIIAGAVIGPQAVTLSSQTQGTDPTTFAIISASTIVGAITGYMVAK